jgi:tellurite methyltransferase
MKTRAWDNLWQDKERQALWSKPDSDVLSLIPKLKREKVRRVLDLGCGVGRHVVLMAKHGFEVCALDSSQCAIEHCQNRVRTEGVQATIEHGDMAKLTYPNSFFDFVLAWNVIYHATRKRMVVTLDEVRRVLRRDGIFYLTLNSTRNKNCGKGTEVEDNTYDNPEKEDGQHLHHYSDECDVRDLLSNWHIESIVEAEENVYGGPYPDSWHWKIVARNSK